MSWKEEFLARKMDEADWAEKDLTLGTFHKVKDMVKKSFKPFNGPGDTLEEMKTLRMASNGNIHKHVAKFRMLVTKSGLMALVAIMDLFQETLPTPLQKQIMTCENPPTTLNQWYEKSTKFHSNWQRMQRIFGRKTEGSKKEEGKKRFSFLIKKEKDLNAMDVDMMSTDEQSQLIKKGACFNCKQVGHLS